MVIGDWQSVICDYPSVVVSMDKTPPAITGRPAEDEAKLCPRPVFFIRYSDELSGTVPTSLQVLLDNNDITANFHSVAAGAYYKPLSDLATGQHTWQVTVADQAGGITSASATFTVGSGASASYCEFPNVNITDGMVMPDVEAVWVQGQRSSDTEQVTFSVNFGDEQPFNARWDQFGFLVPLDFGTNILILTGSGGEEAAYAIERSDRYRAKLHAPTSGDFVMSEPAMGYFANGQPQTASGTVSATLDAGTPEEAVLLSVSVNGVACTITGPDANGNMTFTGQNPCSVSTNFTSATVTVCYTNSTTNVCHTIPLGVWEGYFVQQRRAEIENRSLVLMFQRFPGNLCNGIYDWFVPNFPPIIRTDIRFSLAASGGVECTTNQLGNARTSDSSHCADAPDFDALVYEYNVPPNGLCEQRSQPTSRGLTFGYSKEHEFRSNDYNNDAVFDDELVSTVSFYWPSGETNEIVFTAPIYYGTNTPVIFTFEGVNYATTNALDLSQVTYDGNTPVTWSNEVGQVGYLLTVNGGNYYTNNRAKFSWPAGYTATSTTNTCQNCPPSYFGTASTYTVSDKEWLTFSGFHNQLFSPRVNDVSFSGDQFLPVADDTGVLYEAPHWHDSDGDGWADSEGTEWRFPVCYVRNSGMRVSAYFQLGAQITGDVTVVGTAQNVPFVFEKTVTLANQDAFEINNVAEKYGTKFPNSIERYNPLTILWTLRLPGSSSLTVVAGTTDNRVYVTLDYPGAYPLYESVLDIGCRAASVVASANGAVNAIWTKEFVGTDGVRRKAMDGYNRVDGTNMTYWGISDGGDPDLEASVALHLPDRANMMNPNGILLTTSTGSTRFNGVGTCGAWAYTFYEVLRAQGIAGSAAIPLNVVTIYPPVGYTGFHVKNWSFNGQGSAPACSPTTYIFNTSDLTRQLGIAGQNFADPKSAFPDHQIVRYGTTYFDPSYGRSYPSATDYSQFDPAHIAWELQSIAGFGRSCSNQTVVRPKTSFAAETIFSPVP
jgi:hypothetical protein